MAEETKTTETNTETEDTGLVAAELAADRVRGVDGKFLSRAAQAQKKKTEPTHRQETGATSAAAPGATDDPAAQPAAEENAEEKTAVEVVKSDKLRRVLELEAKARETEQRVEAREREVVQFYEVAKQYETKLAEREKALAERERTWTPDAIHADPVGWLLDHQVDPDRLLQALADSNGQRRPQRQRDERDKAIEELQAEVRKLREDGPEWLRKEREQQRAAEQAARVAEQAARVAEAERWFVEQAQDRQRYPNILRRYDADEVPYQIAKIFRTAAARGERLDDEAALGMLESTCRSKLDRITSEEEGQGAKAKGQAVGAQGNSSRESESSLSSVLSGQRATLPTRRPRAERLRDFDTGKIVISDE